jgi:hypothetical protein
MARLKEKRKHNALITARLDRCFSAGSIDGLFPILKNWPLEELDALIHDIDRYAHGARESIKAQYLKWLADTKTESSRELEAVRDREIFGIEIITGEIYGVALYYLGRYAGLKEVTETKAEAVE